MTRVVRRVMPIFDSEGQRMAQILREHRMHPGPWIDSAQLEEYCQALEAGMPMRMLKRFRGQVSWVTEKEAQDVARVLRLYGVDAKVEELGGNAGWGVEIYDIWVVALTGVAWDAVDLRIMLKTFGALGLEGMYLLGGVHALADAHEAHCFHEQVCPDTTKKLCAEEGNDAEG